MKASASKSAAPTLAAFIVATAPRPCVICPSEHVKEVDAARRGVTDPETGLTIKPKYAHIAEWLAANGCKVSEEDVRVHFKNHRRK